MKKDKMKGFEKAAAAAGLSEVITQIEFYCTESEPDSQHIEFDRRDVEEFLGRLKAAFCLLGTVDTDAPTLPVMEKVVRENYRRLYCDPEDFPIPESADPVDCLFTLFHRMDGILSLVCDLETGRINLPDEKSSAHAIWSVQAMIRQSQELVRFWHKQERNGE